MLKFCNLKKLTDLFFVPNLYLTNDIRKYIFILFHTNNYCIDINLRIIKIIIKYPLRKLN